jgi:hypothetical protein
MGRETVKVAFSTFRNIVKGKEPDGSERKVKQFRKAVELAPSATAGTQQDALIGWAADMCEHGEAARGLAIVKAGSTLPAGWAKVWDDVVAESTNISDAKANLYVLKHVMEEPFRGLALAGKADSEAARHAAKLAMRQGIEPTQDDISEGLAKLLDKARKEHWDAVEALPATKD